MGMSSLFGIGSSALAAFQRALDTTSHNIANVNTEGYSRQQVELVSRTPQFAGFGYVGTGVETRSVRRLYDGFVESQVRGHTASNKELETFHSFSAQVDDVLADADAGMSTALQRFFGAMQDLANDPASTVTRQAVLSEARGLADRFHSLNNWLESVGGQVDNVIQGSVDEVNQLTAAIADLNEKIVLAQGMAGQQPPNDLLDQRNSLIRQLSEQVSVTTIEQDNGAVNVMVGTGQALVVGNSSKRLVAYRGEGVQRPLKVGLEAGGNGIVPVSQQLSGGVLGGALGFRKRVLDPTIDDLGRIALGVGQFVNEQQRKGMDLNGALGQDLFSLAPPQWDAYPGVSSSVSLAWDDIGRLTGAEYKLQYDGSTWNLTRTDTGQSVAMSGSGTAADPFVADGMRIVVDPAAAAGDAFLLQPARAGAADLDLKISDPSLLAAAAPVIASASAANTGSAAITPGEVSDITNPAFQASPGALTPPVLVRFTSATSYEIYDNSNPASPTLLESVSGYDPAAGADLFPSPGGLDYGYRVRLSGAAAAGDQFTIDYNSGGTGDNRNALAMADLFNQKLLGGGSESVNQAYQRMVGEVGSTTRQAELAGGAQRRLLDRAVAEREAISGVNLDEEAANLVRFQQAYQAAAQVISAADKMFQTLLNATRG